MTAIALIALPVVLEGMVGAALYFLFRWADR